MSIGFGDEESSSGGRRGQGLVGSPSPETQHPVSAAMPWHCRFHELMVRTLCFFTKSSATLSSCLASRVCNIGWPAHTTSRATLNRTIIPNTIIIIIIVKQMANTAHGSTIVVEGLFEQMGYVEKFNLCPYATIIVEQ